MFKRHLPSEQKPGRIKLNLCCGTDIKKGFINIDKYNYGQQIVQDLDKGIPSKNNSVDYITIYHGLEHLDNPEKMLKEMNRVLKIGGIAEIKVPHYSSRSAYMLSHKRVFSWGAFTFWEYWLNGWDFMREECGGGWRAIWSRIMFTQQNTRFFLPFFFEWFFNYNEGMKSLYDELACKYISCYEIWVMLRKVK